MSLLSYFCPTRKMHNLRAMRNMLQSKSKKCEKVYSKRNENKEPKFSTIFFDGKEGRMGLPILDGCHKETIMNLRRALIRSTAGWESKDLMERNLDTWDFLATVIPKSVENYRSRAEELDEHEEKEQKYQTSAAAGASATSALPQTKYAFGGCDKGAYKNNKNKNNCNNNSNCNSNNKHHSNASSNDNRKNSNYCDFQQNDDYYEF